MITLVLAASTGLSLAAPKPAGPDAGLAAVPQTGTLSGTVTDDSNGDPVAGATVTTSTFSATTDGSGNYTLVLPAGSYNVTASKFGYSPLTVNGVVVTDDQTTDQDFALDPLPAVAVDGFITDGSGSGRPLYARVSITTPGGSPVVVFTNPSTGYYTASLTGGTSYTFSVTAQVPGYNSASRSVTTGAGDSQESFALQVDVQACIAPGYGFVGPTLASADFTGGIPAGWTVQTATTGCNAVGGQPAWSTTDAGNRTNLTGGTGLFAIADSDRCGSAVRYDSNLLTPAFDLSTQPAGSVMKIEFNSDYRNLCTTTAGDEVKLQVFNGTAWVDVFVFCGTGGANVDRRGPRLESFTTTAAGNAANAQVRFRYKGGFDWWWEVDNVRVRSVRCLFTGGGLLYGNVTDENTDLPLNGATVALDTGGSVTTVATPEDPNIGDGFYIIHAPLAPALGPPGTRTLTVSKPLYGTLEREVVPRPNGADRQDFALPAPQFTLDPTEMRERLAIGGSADRTLTITNTGSIDGTFGILELDQPVTAPVMGRIEAMPAARYDESTKEGYLMSTASSTEGLDIAAGAAPDVPAIAGAGGWVTDWPTGLAGAWGNGFDLNTQSVWVGNIQAAGGDNRTYRFQTNGTNTGDVIQTAFGGTFQGDLTYNVRTGKLWVVNVGGDNCLYELDPVTETPTGGRLCSPLTTSMRGVAHNPVTNTFYQGSWNLTPNGTLLEVNGTTGAILRSTTTLGLGISGLAYSARSGLLYAQVNAQTQLVYVIDTKGPTFRVVGAIELVKQDGSPAYAAFAGAGLELDCNGVLWSVNQTDKRVYANESGETNPCVTSIPWVSEDPTSGTVPADDSTEVTVSFDAGASPPGCNDAQLIVNNNTPYGPDTVELGLTIAFNDVTPTTFGDKFIHAIAGEGISFGCGAGNFCPTADMTRRNMAVWLLRAQFGADYNPPPATGIFQDVPPESFGADYIEDLYRRGITGGCSVNPLLYCPDTAVTREQMSIFLLRTKEGTSYTPPACTTPKFGDVPASSPFCRWIEELDRRGITGGCSTNPPMFCPTQTTNRAQMSVFVSGTWGIAACQQ